MDEALSDSFSGVLVSDFYAAYHHYDGPKQRCWVHLLRDIHDRRALYPDDAPLRYAVHGIYDRAKDPQQKRRRTAHLERQLLAICQPFRRPLGHPGQAVPDRASRNCRLRGRTGDAAERSLRHLVVSRKVSGGTRSQQGTEQEGHLARPRTKSPRRLPSAAHCPTSLNCYMVATKIDVASGKS